MRLLACCPSWFCTWVVCFSACNRACICICILWRDLQVLRRFTPSRSRPRVESAARPDVDRCEVGKVVLDSGVWRLSRIVQHRVLEY
ncbi:hypothetical protein B0T26DRAFT_734058, partial [Lasiosphaeria miniovina]